MCCAETGYGVLLISRKPLRGLARTVVAPAGLEPGQAKEELIEFEGRVSELPPNSTFLVKLDNGAEVIAYASGKMRKHRIRILAGDRVTVEMSPTT